MGTYNPTPIGSLTNQTAAIAAINENFNDIADVLSDKLDRVSGLPNHMERDLDMNSNHVINVADPIDEGDAVNLRTLRNFDGSVGSGATIPKFWQFVGDGSTKDFVISGADVADDLHYDVAIAGVAQNPGVDYDIIIGPAPYTTSIIRFAVAPANLAVGWAVLRAFTTNATSVVNPQAQVFTIADQTATLDGTYKQGHILCTNALPVTLTLRKNTGSVTLDWKSGDYFVVKQKGAGTVTVVAQDGTIEVPGGLAPKTRVQNSVIGFVCDDALTNTWACGNDMGAAV
jgi:hypothetical protein